MNLMDVVIHGDLIEVFDWEFLPSQFGETIRVVDRSDTS